MKRYGNYFSPLTEKIHWEIQKNNLHSPLLSWKKWCYTCLETEILNNSGVSNLNFPCDVYILFFFSPSSEMPGSLSLLFSDSYFISVFVTGVLFCEDAQLFVLKGNTGIVKSKAHLQNLEPSLKASLPFVQVEYIWENRR